MKFITPIYEGTVGNVNVLNKLLESIGCENRVPYATSLEAFAYYDKVGIITIELSYIDNIVNEHNCIVVQQDCDEYYYFDWKIHEM